MDKQTFLEILKYSQGPVGAVLGLWVASWLNRRKTTAETDQTVVKTENLKVERVIEERKLDIEQARAVKDLAGEILEGMGKLQTAYDALRTCMNEKGLMQVREKSLELEIQQLNTSMALLREQNTNYERELIEVKGKLP